MTDEIKILIIYAIIIGAMVIGCILGELFRRAYYRKVLKRKDIKCADIDEAFKANNIETVRQYMEEKDYYNGLEVEEGTHNADKI